MSDFAQGALAGQEANKQNPFNTILSSFQSAQARRYKEDQQRKAEEAELSKALMVLQYKDNYDRALEKEKAKEEKEKISFGEVEKRKSGLLESIRKGEVQEAPPESEIGGNVFEGTPFGATGRSFKSTKTTDVTSAEGLSSEQQVQGRALAKKFYGTRGIKEGVPAIFAELKSGKTIDQVEDEFRFAGQSPEFAGIIRNAAQSIMAGKSSETKQSTFDDLDDLKDMEDKKGYLRRLAVSQAPVDIQNKITGKERTIELLDEIEGDLDILEKNGINTNILSGTYEEVRGRIGTVGNPELRKIITKINTTIYNYRKDMSGVAFPDKETRDYKRIFPGGDKTKDLNKANINALRDVFGGDVKYFYEMTMGKNNYQGLFRKKTSPGDVQKQGGKTITLPSGKTITIGQ